jgi:hypothetical protein
MAAMLTACEIEDDLEIRADGSGTYRATIMVERIVSPVLDRIRAGAEQEGFRIVEEGGTLTRRFIIVHKDFSEIRSLSGPRSNFDLKIDTRFYVVRRYRLRATVASVADGSFERRFTITMPARVKSTTAGGNDGRRVTWYCKNGGTIEVVAEGVFVPLKAYGILAVALLVIAAIVATIIVLKKRDRAAEETEEEACAICHKPLGGAVRYCPSCGGRVLPPA